MSQEKAQLIAPQGHFTVPGLNVAGVVTASSFSGNCTGTASSIAQGTNVVVGVMTASSFAGDVFGNAAGLSTTTAGLKLGIVTATSFAGNFTGIGSGLTGTPNIVAGLVTASQFVGNTPGLAAGISAGKNLAAGIVTATTFYGDGSNLTGAGSTAYIRQDVTVTTPETTINLNDGNIIYYNQAEVANTTISIANTSTAEDVTIIRSLDPYSNSWDDSISTASVDFDSGEYLTQTTDAVLRNWFDQAFTVEYWIKADGFASTDDGSGNVLGASTLGSNSNWTWSFGPNSLGQVRFAWRNTGGSDSAVLPSKTISTGTWYHLAFVREESGACKIFIDGELQTLTANGGVTSYTITDGAADGGTFNIGKVKTANFDGKISNLRITHQALYGSSFTPPSSALTTTSQGATASNVKLLCCQSTTDDTAATVTPNTISANGTPTPASDTITQSGSISVSNYTITWPSSITWNGGSAPTLANANTYSLTGQVFNLVTYNGGTTWYGYEEVNNTTLSSNLTLWAWGHNNIGKLGQNTTVSHSSPIQIPGDWSRIPQGQGDAFNAVKPDGTLWSWGNNSNGGLGLNQASPVKISSPTQIGSGTDWARPGGAGDNARSAVKTDGTLWMWGKNSDGTLGQNDRTSRSSPVQVPGTTWSTAAHHLGGTDDAMAAIKTDGTLWTWGSGLYGMLGLNTGHPVRKSSPTQIPGTWTSVGGHNYMMAATKSDGTLWTWGENSPGVLGDNSRTQRSSPVQVPGTNWAAVSPFGGYGIMSALKTDGTLWTWGANGYGSLGQNNRTSYSSPVQVGSDTTWKQPAAGGTDGITGAVKTDGTLWTWGYNYAGALGQNLGHGTGTYSSPVQVPGTAWQEVIVSKDSTFALQSS